MSPPPKSPQSQRPMRYIPRRVPSPLKSKRIRLPRALRRFLFPQLSGGKEHHEEKFHWSRVLWLTGVDYFSTLGYQPGIALAEAGAYAPIATVILVFITLFGAVPTYREVAKRSYMGQGSIAMLENLLGGWLGKFLVLMLIGFASTDFVITITLSAADAAAHIVENPIFSSILGHSQLGITCMFLVALTAVFLLGFSEAIRTAMFVSIPYIILTVIILVKGLLVIIAHPEYMASWINNRQFYKSDFTFDYTGVLVASALIFPKLALGLSGFETGVSVMPLVENGAAKSADSKNKLVPTGRISGTKKLLTSAAVLMSILLLTSSITTTVLMSQEQVQRHGNAYGRALSYLAHLYLGEAFGTVYDLSTVTILWFAGASALAGLLSLIPRYLPRFGMAPRWVEQRRPLVLLLFFATLVVTFVFNADVEAQSGAYATGVLVLILSASLAVALAFWREFKQTKLFSPWIKSFYFWIVTLAFLYTFIENVRERPDGIIISACFIGVILLSSGISRWLRSFEIRVDGHKFLDTSSEELWRSIRNKKVNMVPISTPDVYWQEHREAMIRNYYKVRGPLAFLAIRLRDDRSEFMAPLTVSVKRTGYNNCNYLIEVTAAIAIPNTIAYVSEQLDPIALYLGLARKNAMEQAFSYLLFGEGEIGIITYKVLVQHWESTEEDDVRPVIFLMSE